MSGELRVEGVTVRVPPFDDAFTVESIGVQTPGFLFLVGFDKGDLEFPERLGIALKGIRVSVDADFMRKLDELRAAQIATSSSRRPKSARARPASRRRC